jgi:hypothetical protein
MHDGREAARAHGCGVIQARLVIVALLVAACSNAPTASEQPALSDATATATPTSVPAPVEGSILPSLVPSTQPSSTAPIAPEISAPPATSDASAGWTAVLPPLPLPAAYIDLGFAGNGELIVLGTDDITARPAIVWVARYRADGIRRSKVTLDRRMQLLTSRDFFHVDPTDDSVVFAQVDFSTGYWHAYRLSSATGKVLESLKLNAAATYVVPTPTGRLLGITPTWAGPSNERACVIIRIASNGGVASGIDYFTERCATVGYSTGPAYFGDAVSIDVANGGEVLLLDWAEDGFRRHDEPAGLGLTVLTPGLEFVRHLHLPKDWQVPDIDRGISQWGATLAGDSAGRIYLLNEVRSADNTTRTGLRLGVFDASGLLVAAYGYGGDAPGLEAPIAARIGPDDRLWVVDLDTVAKGYAIKRLDGPGP